jgi:3-deoxy-D-manno-octulosonic-acid transferase
MLLNFLYCFALWLASPMVIYRSARFGRYRRGVRQKFLGLSPGDLSFCTRRNDRGDEAGIHFAAQPIEENAPVVWFHAVSVGEVNLVAGLIEAFRAANPGHRVVVSTSTDTGYDLAKSRLADLPVFFFPLDFTWAVNQTFKTLRPRLLVLAELELWPNLIRHAGKWGCPVAIANGRLSDRSAKNYRRFSRFLAPTFARIDWIGCQDLEIAERFKACGAKPESIAITGSIKFDNAPVSRDTPEVARITRWAAADPWHQVFIAGSTQDGEEAAALDSYRALSSSRRELRLVIVPRHRERFNDVASLIQSYGYQVRRRSEHHLPAEHWSSDTVVLVDTVGELRHWWGISRIAFVGGSFGDRGGQNMLEPAGYGSAVCFGPNTQNFRDIARRLTDADAAVRLATPEDLTTFVAKCVDDPPAADGLGLRARHVVMQHRGATERTLLQLDLLLNISRPAADSPDVRSRVA